MVTWVHRVVVKMMNSYNKRMVRAHVTHSKCYVSGLALRALGSLFSDMTAL